MGKKQRIEQIRQRLEEYHKHKNDAPAYFREEIGAVLDFKAHAADDIEFLLDSLDAANEAIFELSCRLP